MAWSRVVCLSPAMVNVDEVIAGAVTTAVAAAFIWSARHPIRKPVRIISAVADGSRTIGRGGGLPWSIPDDYQFFLNSVAGGAVILGRRSFMDGNLPKKPAFVTIVLSRDEYLDVSSVEGARVCRNLTQAITLALRLDEVQTIWIGGGEVLYREALPIADELWLTHVCLNVRDGDRFFPSGWEALFPRRLDMYRTSARLLKPHRNIAKVDLIFARYGRADPAATEQSGAERSVSNGSGAARALEGCRASPYCASSESSVRPSRQGSTSSSPSLPCRPQPTRPPDVSRPPSLRKGSAVSALSSPNSRKGGSNSASASPRVQRTVRQNGNGNGKASPPSHPLRHRRSHSSNNLSGAAGSADKFSVTGTLS